MDQMIADFKFAESQGSELKTQADILRYVAAINEEATLQEFVEAAVTMGYKANSAANRYRESRKIF